MNYSKDKYNSPDEVLDYQREEEAIDPDYEYDQPDVTEADHEIIELFEENSAKMRSHWDEKYSDCEDDWDVYNLEQWTDSGKRARGRRPRVTVDISRKFVKAVVAETFRNPPGVKLTARNDKSSKKAKYISDAIRYFEDKTGAIYAYSYAKECAAVCGIGWLKVTYRYDEQQAMPAVIDVDRVDDPLSIMIDPDSRELDGSDANFMMEIHGKSNGEEKYTYWWKDKDGAVKWALICGSKIEDKGIFPTTDIPLVPVYGEVYNVRNKVHLYGIIRQLKDTQRTYNYVMSEAVERMALTPKSPITAVMGSIPNTYKHEWIRSMTEPVPILFWNNKDENGNPTLPQPMRNDSNPDTGWVSPMLTQLQMTANEVTGIFPDSYGDKKSVESGVAIRARMESADRGQLVYDEHLQVSIKQVGLLMLDLLEPVVTPAGILPIMSEDGNSSTIPIGQATPALDAMGNPMPMIDPMTGQPAIDMMGQMMPMMNEPELPDLNVTDLEISVSAAPAYATRKAEGLQHIMEMLPMMPPEHISKLVPQVIRDMDFPGADDYANVLAPDPSAGPDPMMLQQQVAEMEAQMQQMTQMTQELQNQNMQLTIQLNNNTQAMMGKAEMDNQTKLAIEQMKQEGKLTEAMMKVQASSQSDDKKIMADRQARATDDQMTMIEMDQDVAIEMAKLSQSAEKDNAEIALKAGQQQQQLIDRIQTQSTPEM